jgi:hypothetical protein
MGGTLDNTKRIQIPVRHPMVVRGYGRIGFTIRRDPSDADEILIAIKQA